tara:strand:- start:1258 stop:1449 length:192 start_codon:yes stop_codon:yes gene_type:complete
MDKIQELIKGYKTYMVLVVMMVFSILGQEGVIEPGTADGWIEKLMFLGGATLTAKLNRFGGSA